MVKEFWDKKFNSDEYIYGKEPNNFLKSYIDQVNPGKILLPGDGEGRNAVYAAKKGWDVTALDYSTKAKEKALKLGKQNKVTINFHTSKAEEYTSSEKFDLIAIIFLHLTPDVRPKVHDKIIHFLKPGGTVLMECFSKDQIDNNSGGPKSIDLLYNETEIERDFKELNIKQLKKTEIELNEGSHHQGKASVIRMIAEKL